MQAKNKTKNLINRLLTSMPTLLRRIVLINLDLTLLIGSFFMSNWLIFNEISITDIDSYKFLIISFILIGIPTYIFTNQYKGISRYIGSYDLYLLALRNFFIFAVVAKIGTFIGFELPNKSFWLVWWMLLTFFSGAFRLISRDMLINFIHTKKNYKARVAIYGAGSAGAQLAAALRLAGNHKIVTFIDDNSQLWNRTLNGIRINSPHKLKQFKQNLDQVLLAIPSLNVDRRREIIKSLQKEDISILRVPSFDSLTIKKERIDNLEPIPIEELLGRDVASPKKNLLGPGIKNAVVVITGAGGSIGSELCRQVIKLNPKSLIILDNSELNLYKINNELSNLNFKKIHIKVILGSTTNFKLIKKVFMEEKVQVVFHAAAYKHVPLVEENPLEGLYNNVFSTKVISDAALETKVKNVILISSDKAVRPTNVMGASKRLSELIIQAKDIESRKSHKFQTLFSMVRFGNVLDSSGSVIPLFREQISKGGPITLTHPNIIRYFMTITEAAQLVLQSLILSKGGDVFLLDMGKPIRIKDMAEQMIRLSGLKLKDKNCPNGDIEITIKNLRPGEKLFEELLIDAKSIPTSHPLIYRANESYIDPKELWPNLKSLEKSLINQDKKTSLAILSKLVPEWFQNSN